MSNLLASEKRMVPVPKKGPFEDENKAAMAEAMQEGRESFEKASAQRAAKSPIEGRHEHEFRFSTVSNQHRCECGEVKK